MVLTETPGAKLIEAYGTVPLARSGGLGIAMFSYDGKLCIGVNADYDRVADLDVFTALLAESIAELVGEARRRAAVLVDLERRLLILGNVVEDFVMCARDDLPSVIDRMLESWRHTDNLSSHRSSFASHQRNWYLALSMYVRGGP